ncbi:MAG: peptidoglycan-binding protein, partial [Candidatus Omnitrophica bacterium]|nr:peptidoglycan-binding protein [Candidatus Omnitrophota bacterium]
EMQEPLSMEALSTLNTEAKVSGEAKAPAMQPAAQAAATLEPLPPAGPYKPTAMEIQTALKNANYYTGAIDGKIGPMTKKAIEEFQKANGLKADGKIGPKTWAVLGTYLNVPSSSGAKKR